MTIEPKCLNPKGGRNGIDGLQPSLCDRVYDSDGIAVAITTSQFFMPGYLIKQENGEELSNDITKPGK